MDSGSWFLTLSIPWTHSMPSHDVNAATWLAEASWRRDKVSKWQVTLKEGGGVTYFLQTTPRLPVLTVPCSRGPRGCNMWPRGWRSMAGRRGSGGTTEGPCQTSGTQTADPGSKYTSLLQVHINIYEKWLHNKQIRRIVVPRAATNLTLKRSKVKVKVTAWCQLKGLVTRIMHAKYQCSTINT